MNTQKLLDLASELECNVVYNEPLSKHTTFRTGGACTAMVDISSEESLAKLVRAAHEWNVRYIVVGNGSNLLFDDKGYDEVVDDSKDMTIFDQDATWKTKKVYNFTARELQVPVFKGGELVYKLPSLEEIRAYCLAQVDTLWDEVKRFDNPQTYYVDDLLKSNGR